MKPTVLVVGGAGYIGSHVNQGLARRGYPTVVYDNLLNGHREAVKWGDFALGELADPSQLRLIFQHYRIEAVMHFAGLTSVGESVVAPDKYYANNVAATLNLLNIMREFDCRYFIFSSSAATYGLPLSVPITEDHRQDPVNPYGQTKLMVEKILSDFAAAYQLRYVALRYFNAAGADPGGEIGEDHQPETHLIPIILDVAAGRRPALSIFGDDYDTPDGTCVRDYIHVSDLAEAHILALEYLLQNQASTAFNLGNGQGYSVREVIECAEKVTGRPIRAVISARRPGDPPILVGSAARAISELGWQPSLADLATIVATAWHWHQGRKEPSNDS